MEEKNEGRINIEDLPQAERELTAEEANEVKGGTGTTVRDGATLQVQGSATTLTNNNTYRGLTHVD
jgi:hypothetical protein